MPLLLYAAIPIRSLSPSPSSLSCFLFIKREISLSLCLTLSHSLCVHFSSLYSCFFPFLRSIENGFSFILHEYVHWVGQPKRTNRPSDRPNHKSLEYSNIDNEPNSLPAQGDRKFICKFFYPRDQIKQPLRQYGNVRYDDSDMLRYGKSLALTY